MAGHGRVVSEAAKRALDNLTRRRLATAHLGTLHAARRQGLPADETEIEQAREAAAQSRNEMIASFRPLDARSTSAALAERVRCLAVENDPDAVREGLAEIADALDGLTAA